MLNHRIDIPSIQAGDTYTFTLPSDVTIDSGYTAHLALASVNAVYDFTFSGTTLSISASSTGSIIPGLYTATLYEINGTSRNRLYETILNVYPNYTQIAAQSKTEIRLALIESEISRRETGGDASYSAANISITKISYKDLCDERDKIQEIVWAEQKRKARSLGLKPKDPLRFEHSGMRIPIFPYYK